MPSWERKRSAALFTPYIFSEAELKRLLAAVPAATGPRSEIGADTIPQVIVHNKIDRLEGAPLGAVLRDGSGKIRECRVSALQAIGIAHLRETIKQYGLEDQANKTNERVPRVDNTGLKEITKNNLPVSLILAQ